MSANILAATSTPLPGLVHGQLVPTSNTYTVIDPHDPKTTIREVYCVNEKEAATAIESAAEALVGKSTSFLTSSARVSKQSLLPEWRDSTIESRREIFGKAVDILKSRQDEFVKIQVSETTISKGFAVLNVMLAIWWYVHFGH